MHRSWPRLSESLSRPAPDLARLHPRARATGVVASDRAGCGPLVDDGGRLRGVQGLPEKSDSDVRGSEASALANSEQVALPPMLYWRGNSPIDAAGPGLAQILMG
jgi:hypothetical protein